MGDPVTIGLSEYPPYAMECVTSFPSADCEYGGAYAEVMSTVFHVSNMTSRFTIMPPRANAVEYMYNGVIDAFGLTKLGAVPGVVAGSHEQISMMKDETVFITRDDQVSKFDNLNSYKVFCVAVWAAIIGTAVLIRVVRGWLHAYSRHGNSTRVYAIATQILKVLLLGIFGKVLALSISEAAETRTAGFTNVLEMSECIHRKDCHLIIEPLEHNSNLRLKWFLQDADSPNGPKWKKNLKSALEVNKPTIATERSADAILKIFLEKQKSYKYPIIKDYHSRLLSYQFNAYNLKLRAVYEPEVARFSSPYVMVVNTSIGHKRMEWLRLAAHTGSTDSFLYAELRRYYMRTAGRSKKESAYMENFISEQPEALSILQLFDVFGSLAACFGGGLILLLLERWHFSVFGSKDDPKNGGFSKEITQPAELELLRSILCDYGVDVDESLQLKLNEVLKSGDHRVPELLNLYLNNK